MKIKKHELLETILPNDFFKSDGKINTKMDSKPETGLDSDPKIQDPISQDSEKLETEIKDAIVDPEETKKSIKDMISEFISKLIEHEVVDLKIQEDDDFIYIIKNGKTIMMKIEKNVKMIDNKIQIRYNIISQNDEIWDIKDKINDFEKKQGNDILFVQIS